jgi:uncharacterized protein
MSPIFTTFVQNYNEFTLMNHTPSDFHQKPLSNFWGISLLLLLILVFQIVGSALSTWILSLAYQIPKAQVQQLLQEPDFTALSINLGRWSNLIQFIMYMGVPIAIFVFANHSRPSHYWGKFPQKNNTSWLASIVLGISAIPVVSVLTKIMQSIKLSGSWSLIAKRLMDLRETLFENMLDMQHAGELLICLLILALLPAILEEFLFRGIIQKIALIHYRKPIAALLFQAFVFAILHLSLFELPGILLMGLLFGYIALKQHHLYYNALTHFTFNATTILLHYLLNHTQHGLNTYSAETLMANASIAIPASIAMGLSVYHLTKNASPS